jgi:hypothetical protein
MLILEKLSKVYTKNSASNLMVKLLFLFSRLFRVLKMVGNHNRHHKQYHKLTLTHTLQLLFQSIQIVDNRIS